MIDPMTTQPAIPVTIALGMAAGIGSSNIAAAAAYESLQLRIGRDNAARLLELSHTTFSPLETWIQRWDDAKGDRETFEQILSDASSEQTPRATATVPCHLCGAPATQQWQRHATDDEHEAHWTALEQNIRASNSGNEAVDYTADRTDTVVKAVHGCADHAMPDDKAGLIHAADCAGHDTCHCD